jgi:hypothetical protein
VIEIDDNASLASLSAAGDESMMLEENVHIPLKEMWCEYPPKRFGPRGIQLLYSISLIEKLLKGLPLLQELLPPTYVHPVPATSLPVKGGMSILRRILHSHSEGTTWMQSSEMDLMVAKFDARWTLQTFRFCIACHSVIAKAYRLLLVLMFPIRNC